MTSLKSIYDTPSEFETEILSEFDSYNYNVSNIIAALTTDGAQSHLALKNSDDHIQSPIHESDEGYTGSDKNYHNERRTNLSESGESSTSYEKEELIANMTDREVKKAIKIIKEKYATIKTVPSSQSSKRVVKLSRCSEVLLVAKQNQKSFMDSKLQKTQRVDASSRHLLKRRLKYRNK